MPTRNSKFKRAKFVEWLFCDRVDNLDALLLFVHPLPDIVDHLLNERKHVAYTPLPTNVFGQADTFGRLNTCHRGVFRVVIQHEAGAVRD
jgi:hypothetical protein